MNWENYDRLVGSFKAKLRDGRAEKFDWSTARSHGPDDGCVACEANRLSGSECDYPDWKWLAAHLGIDEVEAKDLWAPPGPVPKFGAGGIREALRRLAVVAARYERPSAFVPDVEQFLASVRALPAQSLVEVGE